MKIYFIIIKLEKIHIILQMTPISYFISCKKWAGPEKDLDYILLLKSYE
jgi:hypothetical protein